MIRIFYFNITYSCNSDCLFCLSQHTHRENIQTEMTLGQFQECLSRVEPSQDDLIVLNGGEPTISPCFYSIWSEAVASQAGHVDIYSNGRSLQVNRSSPAASKKTRFIIPIHGSEAIHDRVTGSVGSYAQTMNSLRSLSGWDYSLKFIISSLLVAEKFDIFRFLASSDLHPSSIFLARQNQTEKSERNHLPSPPKDEEREFLRKNINALSGRIPLFLLDYPPCFFPEYSLTGIPRFIPEFFFNDWRRTMERKEYSKTKTVLPICKSCSWAEPCRLMSRSYYLLSVDGGRLRMVLE